MQKYILLQVILILFYTFTFPLKEVDFKSWCYYNKIELFLPL